MELDLSTITAQLQTTFIGWVTRLPTFVLALLALALFFWLARRVARWSRSFVVSRGRSQNAATVTGLIVRWGVVVLGALVALSIASPSFNPGDLIQVLGISSVAISFAFRDVLQNFLAGLIILVTDAFQIGDQIIVESEDLEGTVTEIETRATTISTYDEREIIIPNATLFTNAVTVNTSTDKLRSEHVVGISYDSDIDTACAYIEGAIGHIPGVLSEPAPDVLVDDLGASSVNLRVRWWTDARRSSVVKTRSAVVRQVKYTLDEQGIEIPFPIRTLYMRDKVEVVTSPAASD